MYYLALIEKDMKQNQELRQIEIVKQAESSNAPVLKQKAERIKAEIQAKEAKIEMVGLIILAIFVFCFL